MRLAHHIGVDIEKANRSYDKVAGQEVAELPEREDADLNHIPEVSILPIVHHIHGCLGGCDDCLA